MYKCEKTLREDRYRQERKNPSFSSSLLDEIYRSTDDGAGKSPDLKFFRETMNNKQSKSSAKTNKAIIGDEQISSLRRACLVSNKENVKQRQFLNDYERKLHLDHDHDHDQDALFFSSTSSSSDSSSGGFSSSDTDSLYGSRSRPSCFVPSRPKPVRTNIAAQPEKVKKTETTLFYEQNETDLIKLKSRALKIYSNLKNVKQPISPGNRLANFINSLFTTGNAKKMKNSSSIKASYDDVNTLSSSNSGQVSVSTCSSASSFSRSCLSKNSMRNGDKRSVRFYPVSVIVDEDCRPCGHKRLYEKEDASLVSVATACKIGKSPSMKNINEMAREFLKDYHQNQKKNYYHGDGDDDDDAASCSSSDLFELPVYETTHVDTNRAIAKGLT